jgi:glycogen(starch) synthase
MTDPLADGLAELDVPVLALPAVRSKFDAKSWFEVTAAMWRSRPVIFHAMLPHTFAASYGVLAAITSRSRGVVVTVHAITRPANRRQVWLRRQLNRGVDVQLVPSQWARAELAAMGLLSRRVEVVANGIGFRVPKAREEARALLGLPQDAFVVGSAMRLVPMKRPELVVEVGERLPGVQVVLFGDGPECERLVAQGAASRLHMAGFRRDAADLLTALDVFVLPCPVESQGLAIMEAMAAGVPVVVADVGGAAEVVDDGRTGLLAPVTAPGMAEAVGRLLGDPALGRRLAEAAADEVYRRFSVSSMTTRIESIYSSLLDRTI